MKHRLLAFLLLWNQLASFASAVVFNYIITYGAGEYICHATTLIYINSSNPTSQPEVDLRSVYCVRADGSTGSTFDIPVVGTNGAITGASSYITDLGPVTSRGDRGFEIGINQVASTFANDVHILGMNPRLNMYTDSQGYPLGACSYRQGAVSFAQDDGSVLPPYSSCPGGTLVGSIGRWLICQVGCGRF